MMYKMLSKSSPAPIGELPEGVRGRLSTLCSQNPSVSASPRQLPYRSRGAFQIALKTLLNK